MNENEETRTFRGTVDWSPTAWQGDQKWVYEMVFSADFDTIVGGGVEAIPVDGTAAEGGRKAVAT